MLHGGRDLSYDHGACPVAEYLVDLLRRHDSAGAVCVARSDMAASLFMTMVPGGPVRLFLNGVRKT